MMRLLIVYWSLTGGTRQMAEAACAGAREEAGLDVVLSTADEADAEEVLAADGYMFAAPENLATMAGAMKHFFDRTDYPVLDRVAGRAYGILVCAGSDGEGAARQIARIATGWRLRPIGDPIIVRTHAQTPEAILAPKVIGTADLERCRELGKAIAAGLVMGIF